MPTFLLRKIKYNKAGHRVGKYTKVIARTKQAAIRKFFGATTVKRVKRGEVKKRLRGD